MQQLNKGRYNSIHPQLQLWIACYRYPSMAVLTIQRRQQYKSQGIMERQPDRKTPCNFSKQHVHSVGLWHRGCSVKADQLLHKLQKPTEFDMTFLQSHECCFRGLWQQALANLSSHIMYWYGLGQLIIWLMSPQTLV